MTVEWMIGQIDAEYVVIVRCLDLALAQWVAGQGTLLIAKSAFAPSVYLVSVLNLNTPDAMWGVSLDP